MELHKKKCIPCRGDIPPFSREQIDEYLKYLTDWNVLKGFSLEKYLPDIVIVEFTDNSLKKQEFYYHNIQSVINSEIYKHMLLNHYSFVNWIRSDLVFVSKYIRN